MSIEFSCKSCGTTLRVPDEHLGKQARCPTCQSLNIVEAGHADPYVINDSIPPKYSDNPYSVGQGSVLPPGGVAGRAYQSAHRGGLILTLGVMAIVCNIMAVPGILAWVMGRADLKQMDAGVMDPEGRGLTQAGMIMGMVMTIIGMFAIACYVLFFAVVIIGNVAR